MFSVSRCEFTIASSSSVCALLEPRFQHRQLVGEVVASRDEQLLLVVADLRGDFLDVFRADEGLGDLAALLVLQPGDARAQRARLGLLLAEAGRAHRVVETDDQVVLLDDLADLDGDLLDDAGLARLDDLRLRRRNDLAVAARDLVDLGVGGPDEEGDEQRA